MVDLLLEIPNLGLADGYGQSAKALAKIIIEICEEENISMKIYDRRVICDVVDRSEEYEYFRPYLTNEENPKVLLKFAPPFPYTNRHGAKISICYTMFETDIVPIDWIKPLNEYNIIITPTEWGKKVFEKFVKPPVISIPLPTHPIYYELQKNILPPNDMFRFITVGHYMPPDRKRLISLIETFQREFKYTNAELYVKTNWIGGGFPGEVDIRKFVEDKDTIVLDLNNSISSEDMLQLYLTSHCGLFATVGEGMGLPQAELELLGRLLIVADNTAMTTMKHYYPWVLTLPCKEIPSNFTPQGIRGNTGHWYECSMENFIDTAFGVYTAWENNKEEYDKFLRKAHESNKLRDFMSHKTIKEQFRKIFLEYIS